MSNYLVLGSGALLMFMTVIFVVMTSENTTS